MGIVGSKGTINSFINQFMKDVNIELIPYEDLKPFREEALKAHNDFRAQHKAPGLTLAEDLNQYAQRWADTLVATGRLEHSDCRHATGQLGENIAYAWSSRPEGGDLSGGEATQQWYDEIKLHDFKKQHQKGTGHFTQVVWASTREMGVGKARGGEGTCIVVASYRPAGNLVGAYQDNVIPKGRN